MLVPVERHGFVRLVDHLGDDKRVVESARISYGSTSKGAVKDKKLLFYLWEHGHMSPFEQVSFTFHMKAPIFVLRQLMRHRTGKWNEISARYTEVKQDFWGPMGDESFRRQSTKNKQSSEGEVSDVSLLDLYWESIDLSYQTYEHLLRHGVAREQARAVLPLGVYSEVYVTFDLRNLLNLVSQRDHDDAQEETRLYAKAMLECIREIVPWTVEAYEKSRQSKIIRPETVDVEHSAQD